jgi:uncharacterized protein YlxW (UPF0749 family)
MAEPRPHRTPIGTPPPQATMGLLNYITAHSLDEDYAHVAQRKGQGAAARGPGRPAWAVLAAFGLLIGTAAVQTERTAGVAASSHENLVSQVNAGRKQLDSARNRLATLEREVARAETDHSIATSRTLAERQLVTRLGMVTGSLPVQGPGVKMVVNDAPGATRDENFVLDTDLRDIANGLWAAGAEAISINGQRLTTTTAIRIAGDIITINYVDVVAPYTVLAIGDRRTMPARFVETTTGSTWLNNKERYNLRFEMTNEDSLSIPAVDPKRLTLHSATNQTSKVEGDS